MPPPACKHVFPVGELNPPQWVNPALGGWKQVLQCEWEPTWERCHLSPIFGERWLLACFALPSSYFGLLGGGEVRSDAEGSQFMEGRHLSPISGEGASSPSCAANPPGLVRVVFWLYRLVCCQLCRQICFLTVSSGISLVGFSPGYPGCVIKGQSGTVIICCRAVQQLEKTVRFQQFNNAVRSVQLKKIRIC